MEEEEDITLEHCFQYFTEEECLEEGNEWFCNKCKNRVMAKKKIRIILFTKNNDYLFKKIFKKRKI